MKLRKLVIENYRSLEKVTLEGLQDINILVGKNNSGKSAIFKALVFLRDVFSSTSVGEDVLQRTDREKERIITFELTFDFVGAERESYFQKEFEKFKLHESQRLDQYLNSQFLTVFCVKFQLSSNSSSSFLEKLSIADGQGDLFPVWKQDSHRAEILTAMDSEILSLGLFANDETNKNFKTTLVGPLQNLHTFNNKIIDFFLKKVFKYLSNAYHFDVVRRSDLQQPAQEVNDLMRDGKNLAGVLFTLKNSNSKQSFEKIEKFLREAVPDISGFNSRLTNAQTMLGFGEFSAPTTEPLRINEIGSGIEQVLFVATALEVAPPDSVIFLEEPESHLHPSAQRYLLEQLAKSNRQVFITTHSSVFLGDIGYSERTSIYRLALINQRSKITRVSSEELFLTLQDIGVKNSDILLRDALVFVEDINDEKVMRILAEKLDKSLVGKNIGFVSMGGARAVHSAGKLSSEALTQLHQGTISIPHLFVIDRDERSNDEILELQKKLQNRIYVLENRELENYLLVASSLLRYIKNSAKSDNLKVNQRRAAAMEAEIEKLLLGFIENQKDTLLVKSIAAQVRRTHYVSILDGKNKDRDAMCKKIQGEDFVLQAVEMITTNLTKRARLEELPNTIQNELQRIETIWEDTNKRRAIVSGDEVLGELLKHYGIPIKYLKSHLHEIAEHFEKTDIAPDLVNLIETIHALVAI
jgi:predicted ATPase